MDENMLGNEYYTLTDEDGNESEFELIGRCELKGCEYLALIPAETDGKETVEFSEYVILKAVKEDGEDVFVTIDDDDEFDMVADYFDDAFSQEIDYDGEDDE